ncbi:hypothetical protein H6F88_31430 [Oculatella sp. FACHB-28]|uniref:hypothetical protein n=1 Tax=Cyanophyceae TaxID=3028117 RepID=UPI001686FD41|nr:MULTISPECIES: hypothetical protein [Cyanophyceae]MBD2060457.1 hypothetical protein [Oculatella sp. FACHB-28]MBD2066956.1 hypothetical protein [Leptolyngbya sp. FACHB-671]
MTTAPGKFGEKLLTLGYFYLEDCGTPCSPQIYQSECSRCESNQLLTKSLSLTPNQIVPAALSNLALEQELLKSLQYVLENVEFCKT